jgi:uncharacterized protein (TIGR00299 family) protein
MKALYFDCQTGASTSALLAALCDVPTFGPKVKEMIEAVELFENSYKLESKRVERNGVSAHQVKLFTKTAAAVGNGSKKSQTAIAKFDGKSPFTKETNKDLNSFIKTQKLPMQVKTTLASIFHRLCSAEARTKHVNLDGIPIARLFSPSGFLETIAFVMAVHALNIEKIYCSNVGLGSGVISVEGESIALPRACTLELFKECNFPITLTGGEEATTPLAAAILCELTTPCLNPIGFSKVDAIAYGASRVEGQPAIRLLIGDLAEHIAAVAKQEQNERFTREESLVIETNLDDFTPQAIAYTADELLHMGAADVFIVPCLMKKGRAGHLLTVICDESRADKIKEYLLTNTSTLGIREAKHTRFICNRDWVEVSLPEKEKARVKLAKDKAGEILHAQPEFDDCAKYARKTGKTFREAFEEIMYCYREMD